ncbi:MAG TPA: hypothetical protein PLB89_15620 [Flavobacteriales bacterium]|nr:hypothetical protein [Flavobacteriales bacterium]
MRSLHLVLFLFLHLAVPACTAFKVTRDGRTFVGNNEDSWCEHGRVRFVPGEAGRLGAVYFSSWRGHPYMPWLDQLGMNEAGLVFDGLTVQPKDVAPVPGKPALEFNELTNGVLEQCRDVPEAVAFLRKYDLILLHKSMIFLADAQGRYAVVQNDTILMGEEPYYAVGNWRLEGGTDHDAIPIPRLQQGRALLQAGVAPTVDGAWSVLEGMKSCRQFLENGTFFSTLFEPDSGRVHLAFYHDYSHRITFDLREELQKGAHEVDLPSLFPPNKAFQALQAYHTPFHDRWLFNGLMLVGAVTVLWGVVLGVWVLVLVVRRLRGLAGRASWPLVLAGLGLVALVGLVGVLLTFEQVFYFGLGDVLPALVALPWFLLVVAVVLFLRLVRYKGDRWPLLPALVLLLPFLFLLNYWGML